MGSNNNKKQEQSQGYGPNPGQSGDDPRGRAQNQAQYQQERYESQQGPMVDQFAYNYGRGSEADYANYTDIMNQYRGIAQGGGSYVPETFNSGGGGGDIPSAQAHTIDYKDPFNSYEGFTEFSKTGGYSTDDIANMRARGVSPIRAAYSNANREVMRQRSLQGGYSPNAIAARTRMAREQGQAASDAVTNVEAGIAESRNKGRLAGLTGMSGIETSRLGADLDVAKFNANAQTGADQQNAAYANAAQDRALSGYNSALQATAASRADQIRALQGMTTLYGTTPGMSELFGNQLLQGVQQGGNFGLGMIDREMQMGGIPGQYEQTMGRINDIGDMAGRIANPFLDAFQNRNKNQNGGGNGSGNVYIPPGDEYEY